NALVERAQRTAGDWAEPEKCDSPEQLQRRLDEEDRVQREVYHFDGKQSRLAAYPDLRYSGRPYLEGRWEDICWRRADVLKCLAEFEVERKVDRDGYVSLYDHRHLVGKTHRGQKV